MLCSIIPRRESTLSMEDLRCKKLSSLASCKSWQTTSSFFSGGRDNSLKAGYNHLTSSCTQGQCPYIKAGSQYDALHCVKPTLKHCRNAMRHWNRTDFYSCVANIASLCDAMQHKGPVSCCEPALTLTLASLQA